MERKKKSVKWNYKISFPFAYSPDTDGLFVAFFKTFFLWRLSENVLPFTGIYANEKAGVNYLPLVHICRILRKALLLLGFCPVY